MSRSSIGDRWLDLWLSQNRHFTNYAHFGLWISLIVGAVDGRDIQERVRALRAEIAQIDELNKRHMQNYDDSAYEVHAHKARGERLQQIMDELATLSRRRESLSGGSES